MDTPITVDQARQEGAAMWKSDRACIHPYDDYQESLIQAFREGFLAAMAHDLMMASA